jgi:hypothetical protein
MTTNDMDGRTDPGGWTGNLNDDYERSNGDHPKSTMGPQRDAFVQKNDVEAQPISRTSGPQTNTIRSADGEIAVEGKNKTRPPSPCKRLFQGKSTL